MFQSTRPHGARLKQPDNDPMDEKFQSTRPHGARLLTYNLLHIKNFFAVLCESVIFHLEKYSVVKEQR